MNLTSQVNKSVRCDDNKDHLKTESKRIVQSGIFVRAYFVWQSCSTLENSD